MQRHVYLTVKNLLEIHNSQDFLEHVQAGCEQQHLCKHLVASLKRLEFFDFYQTEESRTLKTLTYVQFGFCKELQVKTLAPGEMTPHTTILCKNICFSL